MRGYALVLASVLLVACGGGSLKAAGELCSASSECETGLVCDFGQAPAVCAMMTTPIPDGAPDAPPGAPDAAADAPPGTPDAAIDAAVDAAIDAAIDAAVPDAMVDAAAAQ